jgi:nucleoside-diphosphate kinase
METLMERTLILLKPDAVERNLCGHILSHLEKAGLRLIGIKMLKMDRDLAERHYQFHINKSFFNSLVNYITSGPIIAAIFCAENAVMKAREAMGATDPAESEPGTIRYKFGLNIEKNTIHGSDSPTTAEGEIKLFFSSDEIYA